MLRKQFRAEGRDYVVNLLQGLYEAVLALAGNGKTTAAQYSTLRDAMDNVREYLMQTFPNVYDRLYADLVNKIKEIGAESDSKYPSAKELENNPEARFVDGK